MSNTSPTHSFQHGLGAVRGTDPILTASAVLHDQYVSRTVSDAEILDHVEHCTHLMELAYERFQASRNPADRAEAVQWRQHRDAALRSLSPAWQAQRALEIQVAIDDGIGYFVHQGELARQELLRRTA